MIIDRNQFKQSLDEFCSLFARSFNREITKTFFEWRYLHNPMNDVLSAFEMDGGRLVGNYSASPCMVCYEGKEYKTALSMTTMTDPDCFGRGIFAKLGTELYRNMESIGYCLIWGFPNAVIHSARKRKLKWVDIYEIPTMVLNLKDFSQEREKIAYDVMNDDRFSLNYECTQNYENYFFVKKNATFLKWRYFDNPINQYRNVVIHQDSVVSSYCVYKIFQKKSLDIVDLQPKNADEAYLLISHIIFKALSGGLDKINTWAPIHFFARRIFEQFGFINREPVTYFGGRWLQSSSDNPLFKDFSNWYIQMGDSDVY